MTDPDQTTKDNASTPARRRGPDLFTLVAGLGTLCVAAYILGDGESWLPAINGRWALAGGALLVGVLLLLASIRGGDRR